MKITPETRQRVRAREDEFDDAPKIGEHNMRAVAVYLQAARDSAVMSRAYSPELGVHSEKFILASIADACEILGFTLVKKGSTQ